MNENLSTVVFINPITGRPSAMPVAMISAYVPFASDLRLEEAAKIAAIRDDEAATNLLESIRDGAPVLSIGATEPA